MSGDLTYQILVAVFSGAVGFMAGLAVSWKTRTSSDGETVYTPTLNTTRGWRALFVIIAILALGSVVLTAVTNDRNKSSVEHQAECNAAVIRLINERAKANRYDTLNNIELFKGFLGMSTNPTPTTDEERATQRQLYIDMIQKYVTNATSNEQARDAIPDRIEGCEVPR